MADPHYAVSPEEKYYFDLRGYLIVRNALSAAEIAACNQAIDHFGARITHYKGSLARDSAALKSAFSRRELTGMLSWPPPIETLFAAS